jgi:hypothetical protein
MGNFFDEVGNCQTCYDEGVVFEYDFIGDFCNDCEKGSVLANDYATWYASTELNEYTLENA